MNGQASHLTENGFGGLSQDTTDKENGTSDTLVENTKERPLRRFIHFLREETTFFRIHLASFTFLPLIFGGIFYASNGQYRISFLDSMFLCYSAMTVTGLSTVNLSTTTKWQQFILYFLMAIGDFTFVSWIMVLIRKRFFRTHCETIVAKRKRPRLRSRKSLMNTISAPVNAFKQREPTPRQPTRTPSGTPQLALQSPTPGVTRANTYAPDVKGGKTNSDEPHMLADVSVLNSSPQSGVVDLPTLQDLPEEGTLPQAEPSAIKIVIPNQPYPNQPTILSPPGTRMFSPQSILSVQSDLPIPRDGTRSPPAIEFAASTNINPRRLESMSSMRDRRGPPLPKRAPTMISNHPLGPPTLPNSPTSMHTTGTHTTQHSHKYTGMGGVGVFHLMQAATRITAPNAYQNIAKLQRKLTMTPSVQTVQNTSVPWLKDLTELVVGRNSDFKTETLSDDDLEELGGAEYRALRMLSYLVPAYFIFSQLIAVILFLPWLTVTKKFDPVFEAQPRLVGKVWFSFFQVMGAYTGGGLSLVDMGMVPFQNAYLMIFALCWVILAGNHALPIFLRLVIWTMSKILPERASAQAALTFLLQHPRRCFIFLFPSHQTWFLVICLIFFSIVEWVCFVTLNIGLPAYESMPTAQKVVEGLFQGLAARASGFAIAPLASLAPALQFLYVVMMYIAIYPVALSIRTTNVYEERSLGIFEAPPEDEDEEPTDGDIGKIQSKRERVGKYVMWHLRRQTSVDIWWLIWAVFLIAIIERKNLVDENKKWFDLFRVLFELVSAFGGIGLTLGLPTENYSFVGSFSPLSKLVVIVIMVRGRHRGLPVAVDKAVLLPDEFSSRPNANQHNINGAYNGQGYSEKPPSPEVVTPHRPVRFQQHTTI